jgi:hypothetical protein
MSARPTKLTNLTVTGNLVVGGSSTVSGSSIVNGVIGENVTVDTGKTLAVTTADKLTVGGKIIPQTFLVQIRADSVVYVLPVACKVVSVKERHTTAESTAATLTAMVNKVPSGTAIGSGTNCLSAGINMKATANTNQTGSLHATAGNYTFAAGDGVGAVLSTSATELALESITVEFQRV